MSSCGLACEGSFEKLKNKLTSAPALTLLEGREDLSFIVMCLELVWVLLMQHSKVVSYFSRWLKVHERNYTTHDFELVAVVFAFKNLAPLFI